MIQRPEADLRMDFSDRRCRARATIQQHRIYLSNLGRYRESLFAYPFSSKAVLSLDSATVIFRCCRCLDHCRASWRWENT